MFTPKADTVNEAGGPAYELSPKAGTCAVCGDRLFNHTFYADAGEQLDEVLELANEVDADFVAKTAVFAREKGFMKDMPALLVAVLSVKDKELFETGLSACHRQRKDAAKLCSDHAFGCGRAKIARLAAKASGSRVVRKARRRTDLQTVCRTVAVDRRYPEDGPPASRPTPSARHFTVTLSAERSTPISCPKS